MRRPIVMLLGALSLGGCQSAIQTSSPDTPRTGGHEVTMRPGDAVVSVVGTPFYMIFKGVVCVASVAVGAPVAAVAALSESRFAPEARRGIGDGVSENCGPPYVLTLSRVVPDEPAPESGAARDPKQPVRPEQAAGKTLPAGAGRVQPASAPGGPQRLFP